MGFGTHRPCWDFLFRNIHTDPPQSPEYSVLVLIFGLLGMYAQCTLYPTRK